MWTMANQISFSEKTEFIISRNEFLHCSRLPTAGSVHCGFDRKTSLPMNISGFSRMRNVWDRKNTVVNGHESTHPVKKRKIPDQRMTPTFRLERMPPSVVLDQILWTIKVSGSLLRSANEGFMATKPQFSNSMISRIFCVVSGFGTFSLSATASTVSCLPAL